MEQVQTDYLYKKHHYTGTDISKEIIDLGKKNLITLKKLS